MVFERRVEACAFEDLTKDTDGVDEVGEGRVNVEGGHEGRVVVVLETGRIGNVL